MFLRKHPNILGIVGVFIISSLIFLFTKSSIRNQTQTLSSFAQAACSKECNVDDQNSCPAPFVCKPKCTGNTCRLKVGTCEFYECPAGKQCGCNRPPPAPFPGHEEYPPSGYGKLSITLNFKTPFYHPDFHTYIQLTQSVKTKEGNNREAQIGHLVRLKKGINVIEFENVPARPTKIFLTDNFYDKNGYSIDRASLNVGFDSNCRVLKNARLGCSVEIEQYTTQKVAIDFEVTSKVIARDNLYAVAYSSLVQPNNSLNIKMFVCDLDKDQLCKTPETYPIVTHENMVRGAKNVIKQLTPGRKKVYFDTDFLYDNSLNKVRAIEKSHLGYYYDPYTSVFVDWHNPMTYFIPAFSSDKNMFIRTILFEQRSLKNKFREDYFDFNFYGRPKQASFVKLVPCGFIGDTDKLECFDENALLKEINRKETYFQTINIDSKYIGWKIEENLYTAQGVKLDEKWHNINLSNDCIPRNNTPSNICFFNALDPNTYDQYLTFENNFASNKNLVGHEVLLMAEDSNFKAELSQNYANAYLRVKICSSASDCDTLYPGFIKLIKGSSENGDELEFLGIDFVPNQTVQLDGYVYNEAGQIISPIPKDWIITTTCHDGHEYISPTDKNACKYVQLNGRYSYSNFVISPKKKEKVTINTRLKIIKKNPEKVTILEREICATQAGYLCRTLQADDYTVTTPSESSTEFKENVTLIQHNEFKNAQKKEPFFTDTEYFIKYSIMNAVQRYEKIFPIEYGAKNEFILDTTKESPINQATKVKRKVKILIHNYYLPSENKNLFEMVNKSTDYAKTLANLVLSALNVPNNPITYEIVDFTELQTFPKFTAFNDATFIENMFVKCAQGFGKKGECEEIPNVVGEVDYVELEKDLNLCESVNNGEIDEVWNVNMPYTPVGEDDIFGPYPININGITAKITKCNKNVPVLGIDVLAPVYQAMHSFGHRAESLKYVFDDDKGDWASPPKTIFEEFILSDYTENSAGKSYVYSGCGSIHFPPNVNKKSLDSYQTTQSICDSFLTFDPPTEQLSRKPRMIDCFEWGCSGEGYYTWWLSHLPTAEGKDEKGRMNNWWQYVIYTENLVKDSAIAKLMVLDQNKNGIFDKADYDEFVTETKTVPVKNQDIILDQNNDQKLTITDFNFYKNKIGTVLPELMHSHNHMYKFSQ